jgi:predicted amidohydrolase
MKSCEQDEAIIYDEIDLAYLEEVRTMLPYQQQKRYDLYKVDLVE